MGRPSILARAEAQVHAGHPSVRARTASIPGSAAGALVELSANAGLIVVGARGTGGFPGLRLGSVAAQVSRHAHGPVTIVQPTVTGPAADEPCGPAPGPGQVVVGVDGSAESEAALGFAFDEATARKARLTALFARPSAPPDNLAWSPWLRDDLNHVRDEGDRMLAEAVARWATKYPEVAVTVAAVHTMDPVSALVAASRDAGLVVVGSRGRGGFSSLLLGSVSHAVLTHAHCPVTVMRAGIDR
jgi:nucleotide-binding universal stress UspA family protein